MKEVKIDYTNWKGERSIRRITPVRVFWGANEWHVDEQWLLEARDEERNQIRNFAMKDIHSWMPAGN